MALERIRGAFTFGGGRKYRRIETTGIVTVRVKSNTPINTPIVAEITINPQEPARSELAVYKNEVWVIEDLFTKGTPAVDGIVEFYKNRSETVFLSQPLSTYDISNPARAKPPVIRLEEFDTLMIRYYNMTSPTADATVTFYIKLVRYKPVE